MPLTDLNDAIPAPTADASQSSNCTCGSLRRASRRVSQFYDLALAPIGIKSTQFSILTEVERHDATGPVSMCMLAAAMVMDRSTLGHNLRPLQRDELLVLRAADDDRRKRRVELTRKGTAILQHGRILWRRAEDRIESVFGRQSAADLRAVLLNIAYSRELDAAPLG
jgi:DNA-binding MarR family transcriptional regulator